MNKALQNIFVFLKIINWGRAQSPSKCSKLYMDSNQKKAQLGYNTNV